MGQASNIQSILVNRQYDLHALKVAYAKALDGNNVDPQKAQALHVQIIALKEEINTWEGKLILSKNNA